MEQRDINSRTRADTFGLRPDLYDALAGNMVKKDDLTTIGGSLGYARISIAGSSPVSVARNSARRVNLNLLGESKGASVVEMNGRMSGVLIEKGIWVAMESFTTRADGQSPYVMSFENEWFSVSDGYAHSPVSDPQYLNVPFISSIARGSHSFSFSIVSERDDLALGVVPSTADSDTATIYNSSMTLIRIV